jgi:hypothetical protein
MWLLTLIALVSTTYICFALQDIGVEFFVDIRLSLISNVVFGSRTYHTYIPLVQSGTYVGFIVSVYCGFKALYAICIPPITRTHNVRVHVTRTEESQAV